MTMPHRPLTCAEMSELFRAEADAQEAQLILLAHEVLPTEMARLRDQRAEQSLRLIAALRLASDSYRGFANLPASMQMTMGVLPDSVRRAG